MTCAQPWTVAWHVLAETNPTCSSFLDNTDFTFSLTGWQYLGYFALTLFLELPFVWRAVGAGTGTGVGRKNFFRPLLVALVLNLATHPLICLYFVNHSGGRTFGEFTLAAEGFAFATEMLIISILYRTRPFQSAAWIFAANLFSWTAGSLL